MVIRLSWVQPPALHWRQWLEAGVHICKLLTWQVETEGSSRSSSVIQQVQNQPGLQRPQLRAGAMLEASKVCVRQALGPGLNPRIHMKSQACWPALTMPGLVLLVRPLLTSSVSPKSQQETLPQRKTNASKVDQWSPHITHELSQKPHKKTFVNEKLECF